MTEENYTFDETIPVEDYLRLRAEARWKEIPADEAQSGLDRSFANVSVRLDGEVVGMARMVWDHSYSAYLTDVVVTEKCRHNGLASRMIELLTDKLRAAKKDGWHIKLHLLAAKGKESFYERLGFSARPNELAGAGMDMWL